MMYHELWAVLSNWRREFTTGEFARTFYSPDPNKVLHDMAKNGMLERLSIGKYKVKGIGEYVFGRYDVRKAYSLLVEAKLPYALTGVDAVYVWTRGGYNVDRFFGFYPIHIKVRKVDVPKWRRLLSAEGWKSFLAREKPGETLFGPFFILYPEEKIKAARIYSLNVDPLKDTVEFCRRNIYAFEPALEMLDEELGLRLGVKYRETETKVS